MAGAGAVSMSVFSLIHIASAVCMTVSLLWIPQKLLPEWGGA